MRELPCLSVLVSWRCSVHRGRALLDFVRRSGSDDRVEASVIAHGSHPKVSITFGDLSLTLPGMADILDRRAVESLALQICRGLGVARISGESEPMPTMGELLREARYRRNLSLDQAEAVTKIRKKYLLALEEDDYAELPAPVYARGFLQIYAEYLGVDPHVVDKLFQPPPRSAGNEGIRQAATGFRDPSPISVKAVLITALTLAGVSAVFFLYAQYLAFTSSQTGEVVPGPTVQVSPTAPAIVALPSPTPSPVPSPSPTPVRAVEVTVRITERCWIRVVADGQGTPLFEGELQPGDERTWKARDRIDMRVGNAGGVDVTVNGMRQGKLGASGEVKNVTWGRQ